MKESKMISLRELLQNMLKEGEENEECMAKVVSSFANIASFDLAHKIYKETGNNAVICNILMSFFCNNFINLIESTYNTIKEVTDLSAEALEEIKKEMNLTTH